jgi:hypothetical protein
MVTCVCCTIDPAIKLFVMHTATMLLRSPAQLFALVPRAAQIGTALAAACDKATLAALATPPLVDAWAAWARAQPAGEGDTDAEFISTEVGKMLAPLPAWRQAMLTVLATHVTKEIGGALARLATLCGSDAALQQVREHLLSCLSAFLACLTKAECHQLPRHNHARGNNLSQGL